MMTISVEQVGNGFVVDVNGERQIAQSARRAITAVREALMTTVDEAPALKKKPRAAEAPVAKKAARAEKPARSRRA